jgi:GNAT superfamily N-acetyltransferase
MTPRPASIRHPTETHWYLALLGTDPSAQGQGLGTTVLSPVLKRCDTDAIPAYTETQRHENVGW